MRNQPAFSTRTLLLALLLAPVGAFAQESIIVLATPTQTEAAGPGGGAVAPGSIGNVALQGTASGVGYVVFAAGAYGLIAVLDPEAVNDDGPSARALLVAALGGAAGAGVGAYLGGGRRGNAWVDIGGTLLASGGYTLLLLALDSVTDATAPAVIGLPIISVGVSVALDRFAR
ncbi:hypothetical protein [Rubricoccus marinus]|uniref:Uncharacterized protein n=1 Tax=Rubricoccus marinus TaxID=716817 RepID=A0A259TUZ9_9BACT|nr:hypothetical protein [Rubricoccus marinus]OZC01447.1 hypothetical protein BSZ36_17370 [Rubricoccus marinus]